MKIVFVGPVYPYRGGISHFTARLATEIEKNGHSVQLTSFSRQYPSWLYPGETDKDSSEQTIKFPAKFLLDPLYPWTWFQTVKEIEAFKPDIVILSWWTTFWAPANACLSRWLMHKGITVSYLIHNVTPHDAKFFDKWLTKLALSSTKLFIVQTHDQEKRLKDLIPHAMSELCVHPIYDFFGSKISREQACSQLQIPVDQKILLFFGIVRPYKGLIYLLEAVSLLKKWGNPVLLLVAGEFWDPKEKYLKFIQEADIQEQVIIFDRYIQNEEVPVFYSAANVFVAPYVNGTQSGAINVARAFGVPFVMTEVIAETVGLQNEGGVPEKDPVALAKAIQNLLDASPVQGLVENERKKTWENFVRAIERQSSTMHPLS